ncbi:MAG: septum formation protein Maf [Elusimicrobia bacterium]|nr:septum formation protein Maf [Elusimicrobiota bacterium]
MSSRILVAKKMGKEQKKQRRKIFEKPDFFLASLSPRRRVLLRRIVPGFRVVPSGVVEFPHQPGERVSRYVKKLARQKAVAVARRFTRGLSLGADTVVARRGRVYGKPVDQSDAFRILSELSGKWHDVYTGLALALCPGRRVWTCVFRSRVQMRKFSPQELRHFSKLNHDKAGAYAAQARGNPYIYSFEGDFDTIVGLPLRGVWELLGKALKAGCVASDQRLFLGSGGRGGFGVGRRFNGGCF